MNRFVFVALLLMAWAYWELSGGASFRPEQIAAPAVTRADTSELDAALPLAAAAAPATIPAADVAALTAPPEEVEIAAAVAEVIDETPEFQSLAAPAEPAVAAPANPAVADLRVVTGERVNLREGPGRDFGAVAQLSSGTVAEVLEVNAAGWAHIRLQDGSRSGWMSADFLLPING